ncbi:AraC-like DNA-binding protein [Erwinia toletana]|uniref:AraC-like DNA-binding protein n=1 Tax=Winslowiella toletana TaxID=92490 RepID=A0ABS4P721_9GAMM|nr:AraC family transcriptional regulator [Winslowiella toletana]MBP2168453.1 AraC-like DNA-binding protein [Winslowiella toletana]
MNILSPQWQELINLIAHFATKDGVVNTAIDFLYFGRRSSPSQPMHISQWASFALVAQGEKALRLGDETYVYGPGDLLLASMDMPVRSCITRASAAEPNLAVAITINPLRLQKFINVMPAELHSAVPKIARGITVNRVSEALLDAVVRLIKLLHRPEDIAMLAPLIEQEIFYRLLTGPEGPRLLNIAMAERPGNKVAQAASWLRENFHQQLKIDQLASSVGMSTSSLHHHFKAVTAMTPMQYQKQLRLNEARRLMLLEKMDAGTAGYQVGYQSASQFSREYSRFYGASPTRDIKLLGQE